MPVERQRWVPAATLDRANAQLRRTVEVLDTADRAAIVRLSASATLAPTFPITTVLVTTSGGNVTLTLPPAATVPGFRVDVKKMTAANTLTVAAAGSETIDDAATSAWTTQYQSNRMLSTGTEWVII